VTLEQSRSGRPDELATPNLSPDDCYEWGDECEFAIQSNRKRATAIGYFAQEMGTRFQDVRCSRGYMRLLTRQESWACGAETRAQDEWIDNHEPPLKLNGDLKWCLPDGTICEPPEHFPVPEDWQPGEDDPAWESCGKDHPDAIPYWRLEEK
jgi:hypothetical protein